MLLAIVSRERGAVVEEPLAVPLVSAEPLYVSALLSLTLLPF